MTFKRLSEYFSLLEQNASRLKMTEILSDLFKECGAEEISKIVYLSLGRLLPQYEGVEFQMAQKMMERAIGKAFGVETAKVRKEMGRQGDLGKVGEILKDQRSKIKVQNLFGDVGPSFVRLCRTTAGKDIGVIRVYERLMEIAQESGEGSVERKVDKMAALLQDLDPLSVRFVVRMPLGKMRLGFSQMTILDALSWMKTGDKSLREKLEDVYNVVADIGKIAEMAKGDKKDPPSLKLRWASKVDKEVKPHLGTPIIPALCQRLGTAEEIVEKLGEMAVEPKYDGTRLQVHFRRDKMDNGDKKDKTDTRIFTRNLENVTKMFPDIVGALKNEITAKEVILDGEGIGIDPKSGKYLPFQETIKRKRKHEVAQTTKAIPINYFVFDVLFYNGENLIKEPLEKRRSILEKIIKKEGKIIKLSPQIITSDPKKLRAYHDQQIANGLEGIVAKKWQSFYEPGRKGFHWVKLKQEMTKKGGGLADTIECVVMGTYRGEGKRTDFGVGAFLAGVKKGEKFVTISKIGTGLTDEQWKELRTRGKRWTRKDKPKEYEIDKNLVPDDWWVPKVVVEIQADNITKSPIHTAGLALRFPRLIRFRDDKSANETTTVKEVEKLFEMQFGKEKRTN